MVPSDQPDLSLYHWQTEVTQQGLKRVQVRADSLVRDQPGGQAAFSGHIQVLFFNIAGDTVSTLVANRGHIAPDGKQLSVAGQVVVAAQDSTRLETDSLRWNRDQDRILGDGAVAIFRPDGQEHGIGFDASADLKHWTLKEVKTQVIGRPK